ncbi:plasminogen-binding N-terminal domain-containing protein [Aliarcobacter lanthieri]|uniref:plasminogen-binding N-terminal domain-containing protein n=1 Tax=Aliarcobacter lanthieri TaxID=1355374 RepID=UPI00047A7D29|nr:plasminogen-binding N-terminal domain-containing protein [Aliarcobacter lanthieri]
MFKKSLFFACLSVFTLNLSALETICYKNGLDNPSQIENAKLEGGFCAGKVTVDDMKKDGWNTLDIKVTIDQGKLSYSYYFYKNTKKGLSSGNYASKLDSGKNEFSIQPIGAKVENLNDNKSVIAVGNLLVGQSGIVVHIYDNDKRLIVSNAKVVSSNDNSSVVEYFPFDDLKQDAIPTTNRTIKNGDVIILNYMYDQSLLIAPDFNSYQAVREDFAQNNFIHPDIFGATLKFDNQPLPKKEDFQKFSIDQNLGTIFFVVAKKIYILDAKTFSILDSYSFPYASNEKQMPFFTRVEEIKGPLIDFKNIPFVSEALGLKDDSIDSSNYDNYYKSILGIK